VAAPSTVALGDTSAPACDDRSGNKGWERRGLHLGRGGRPALVGAIPSALPCLLIFRLGLVCSVGLPARTAQLLDVALVQDHLDDAGGAADR
jgi:hypothetical protein